MLSSLQFDLFPLYYLIFWLAVVVCAGVECVLLYSTYRFYRLHGGSPVEVLWTAAPAFVLAVLLILSYGMLQ